MSFLVTEKNDQSVFTAVQELAHKTSSYIRFNRSILTPSHQVL